MVWDGCSHSHVVRSFGTIDSSSCTSRPFDSGGRGDRTDATKADAANKPGTVASDAAHSRPSR